MPWWFEDIEISGGFLAGVRLQLPAGLTCVIGPRGSGKSTLAEALRFAILGTPSNSKTRQELIQANLGPSSMVVATTRRPRGASLLGPAFIQAASCRADGRWTAS